MQVLDKRAIWDIDSLMTQAYPLQSGDSICREHLGTLSSYAVTHRIGGEDVTVVLGRFKKHPREPYCCLIRSSCKTVQQMQAFAPKEFFDQGCVFTGELVDDNVVMIFDVLLYKGKQLCDFTERYQTMQNCFLGVSELRQSQTNLTENLAFALSKQGKIIGVPGTDAFFFCAKAFVPFNLFGSLSRSKEGCSGFMFVPPTTHKPIYVWKKETIMCVLTKFTDSGPILITRETELLSDAFPDVEFSLIMDKTFACATNQSVVMEVVIYPEDAKITCVFKRVNIDKKLPNSIQEIADILENLHAKPTVEELVRSSLVVHTAM